MIDKYVLTIDGVGNNLNIDNKTNDTMNRKG
jgi:hypothetical protein